MALNIDPNVGTWYRRIDKGREFEVVAFDEEEGVVELQYFDGDSEQMDIESWRELELELIEDPDAWTGPMETLEADELGYDESEMDDEDWEESFGEPKSVFKRMRREREYDWDDGAMDGYRWDEDDY